MSAGARPLPRGPGGCGGGAAGGSLAGVPISPWQAYCGLQGPRKQPTRLVVYRPAVGDGVPAKGSFELVGGEEATSD